MTGTWFRGAALLWGLVLAVGLLGYAIDSETLRGLGFFLRRLAIAVTLLWAIIALLGSVLGSVRGRLRNLGRRR